MLGMPDLCDSNMFLPNSRRAPGKGPSPWRGEDRSRGCMGIDIPDPIPMLMGLSPRPIIGIAPCTRTTNILGQAKLLGRCASISQQMA